VALIVVVLIGVAALTGIAVVLALSDSAMSTEPVDRLDDGIPDRRLTSQDVGALHFRVGLRGYRMDDVDAALDRLREALHDAEARSVAAEQSLAEQAATAQAPAKPARARRPAKKAATPPAGGA
jgi:DivIVA domain-containing protein